MGSRGLLRLGALLQRLVQPLGKFANDPGVPCKKVEAEQADAGLPANLCELRRIDSPVILRDTEEHEPDRWTGRIGVHVPQDLPCGRCPDVELLGELPGYRLPGRLASLDLAARKLPFSGVRLVRSATAYQELATSLEQRDRDGSHALPPATFGSRLRQQYQLATLA